MPDRPADLFLGPVEQQGSLNGIPAARKGNLRFKSTGTDRGDQDIGSNKALCAALCNVRKLKLSRCEGYISAEKNDPQKEVSS